MTGLCLPISASLLDGETYVVESSMGDGFAKDDSGRPIVEKRCGASLGAGEGIESRFAWCVLLQGREFEEYKCFSEAGFCCHRNSNSLKFKQLPKRNLQTRRVLSAPSPPSTFPLTSPPLRGHAKHEHQQMAESTPSIARKTSAASQGAGQNGVVCGTARITDAQCLSLAQQLVLLDEATELPPFGMCMSGLQQRLKQRLGIEIAEVCQLFSSTLDIIVAPLSWTGPHLAFHLFSSPPVPK